MRRKTMLWRWLLHLMACGWWRCPTQGRTLLNYQSLPSSRFSFLITDSQWPNFPSEVTHPHTKNVRCLDLDMLYVCNHGASGHNGFHVLLDWNSPKKTGEWGLWVIVMILMIKGPTELFVVYWHWNHGKLTRQNWWISRVATFKAKLKLSLCDGKGIWNLKVLALLRKLQVQRAENALRAFCAHATIWT